MGAEPGRPNELSPITRIDTARVRPVQSAAGRSFIEPGSPWQNPFVESFDSVLEAQTVITDWRKRCSLLARKVSSKRGNFRENPFLGTRVNKAPAGHRASGRGTMEADLTNTTKEVLRAFPTAACDRRERR